MSLTTDFIRLVQKTAAGSPTNIFDELYSTWDYVSGEDRICHQRTTAMMAHAAWQLPNSPAVDLERCFRVGFEPHPVKASREKAIKWHPDLVLTDSMESVILLADFESPNSSDFRVIDRDLQRWYVNWVKQFGTTPEYLIITSLPDAPAPAWDCRYVAADGYDQKAAQKNPFRYWYGIYKARFKPAWAAYPIVFANFNGKKLSRVDFTKLPAAGRRRPAR